MSTLRENTRDFHCSFHRTFLLRAIAICVAQLSVLPAVRSRHGSWPHQKKISAAVWLSRQRAAHVEVPDHRGDGSHEHDGLHEQLVYGVHVVQEGRWRHDGGAARHGPSDPTLPTKVHDERAILSIVARPKAATWTPHPCWKVHRFFGRCTAR